MTLDLTPSNDNKLVPGDYNVYFQATGIVVYRPNQRATERATATKKTAEEAHANLSAALQSVQADEKKFANERTALEETLKQQAVTEGEAKRRRDVVDEKHQQAATRVQELQKQVAQAKQQLDQAEAKRKQAEERSKPRDLQYPTFSPGSRLHITAEEKPVSAADANKN